MNFFEYMFSNTTYVVIFFAVIAAAMVFSFLIPFIKPHLGKKISAKNENESQDVRSSESLKKSENGNEKESEKDNQR